jgi:transcriptional regulator with XRE-family HTH domain
MKKEEFKSHRRDKLDISQVALARRIKLSVRMISMIETGRRNVSARVEKRLLAIRRLGQ